MALSRIRRSRGLYRPRHLDLTDTRSPMLRLLEDGQTLCADDTGRRQVEVNYDAQWRTLFKAARLGYVEEANGGHRITESGLAFIAREKEGGQ